ncbi:hypothetical protein TIFTF001_040773 [Ficus carica]|uniref:Uncharacterized protein n=1 Tax=Ficus carica TaxID=3494 RepID=A0AA87YYB1_FICCA|nr:hypothetical protein TIFTF001_040773 [Ficus carica]
MAWARAGTRSVRAWLRTRPGSHAGLAEDSARDSRGLGMVCSWNHGPGWQRESRAWVGSGSHGPELAHVEGTAGAGSWDGARRDIATSVAIPAKERREKGKERKNRRGERKTK